MTYETTFAEREGFSNTVYLVTNCLIANIYTIKTTWFLAQYWPVQTTCNYIKYNMLQTNNYSVSVTDSMGLNLILSPSTLYSTVER